MTTKFIPKPYRIERNDCQAMLIDIQEKLAPHIAEHRKLLKKTAILIQGLQALNIARVYEVKNKKKYASV